MIEPLYTSKLDELKYFASLMRHEQDQGNVARLTFCLRAFLNAVASLLNHLREADKKWFTSRTKKEMIVKAAFALRGHDFHASPLVPDLGYSVTIPSSPFVSMEVNGRTLTSDLRGYSKVYHGWVLPQTDQMDKELGEFVSTLDVMILARDLVALMDLLMAEYRSKHERPNVIL